MFLTLEYLEKNKACPDGRKWFAKYFPEGAELTDVMQHRTAKYAPSFLHWGYNYLATTPEEQEIYWNIIKVDSESRETAFSSDNVSHSQYVSRSSKVSDSSHVFSSKNIKNSSNIATSNTVENSSAIFASEFVYNSQKVLEGKNITNSENVVKANNIINSTSVAKVSQVQDSFCVVGLSAKEHSNVEDSYFVTMCNNVKHCIFCNNLNNAEYHVFNRPVSKQEFEVYQKQLKSIIGEWQPSFVKEWPEAQPVLQYPEIEDLGAFYENIPEEVLKWAKTLPGYDEDKIQNVLILYGLFKKHQ